MKFQPHFRSANIDTADAIVVMYSVTDRNSFHVARETLDWLAMEFTTEEKTKEFNRFPYPDSKVWHPPVTCPVLLLANKADLNHLRQASIFNHYKTKIKRLKTLSIEVFLILQLCKISF